MARVTLKSVCQRWPGIGRSESVHGDKGQSLLFSGQTIMPKGLSQNVIASKRGSRRLHHIVETAFSVKCCHPTIIKSHKINPACV